LGEAEVVEVGVNQDDGVLEYWIDACEFADDIDVEPAPRFWQRIASREAGRKAEGRPDVRLIRAYERHTLEVAAISGWLEARGAELFRYEASGSTSANAARGSPFHRVIGQRRKQPADGSRILSPRALGSGQRSAIDGLRTRGAGDEYAP
jgi:hypothetical protein